MRESKLVSGLRIAKIVALQGTCTRRQVGAVAVNKRHHILATGYNGVPSGIPHCRDGFLCAGANSPSGIDLDLCLAVHAETNMLAQCRDIWEIHTVYLTCSPCFSCVKALISSGCQRLVFLEEYPHCSAAVLWRSTGREWYLAPPLPSIDDEGNFW